MLSRWYATEELFTTVAIEECHRRLSTLDGHKRISDTELSFKSRGRMYRRAAFLISAEDAERTLHVTVRCTLQATSTGTKVRARVGVSMATYVTTWAETLFLAAFVLSMPALWLFDRSYTDDLGTSVAEAVLFFIPVAALYVWACHEWQPARNDISSRVFRQLQAVLG